MKQTPSENNFAKTQTALLNQNLPIPIKYIDVSGATNGQVLTYVAADKEMEFATPSLVTSALTSAHIFVGDGNAVATDVAVTGDLTLANTGAFTIANDAVTTVKIANNAVDGTKIALAGQAAGDIMYFNGTDWVVLPIGTAGQVLTVNGGATAPEWA